MTINLISETTRVPIIKAQNVHLETTEFKTYRPLKNKLFIRLSPRVLYIECVTTNLIFNLVLRRSVKPVLKTRNYAFQTQQLEFLNLSKLFFLTINRLRIINKRFAAIILYEIVTSSLYSVFIAKVAYLCSLICKSCKL